MENLSQEPTNFSLDELFFTLKFKILLKRKKAPETLTCEYAKLFIFKFFPNANEEKRNNNC